MQSVRVRVVGKDGSAVPGAHVSIPWASEPSPEVTYLATSDGSLTFALAPGRYRLRADAADGRTGETIIEIPSPRSGNVILLEVQL